MKQRWEQWSMGFQRIARNRVGRRIVADTETLGYRTKNINTDRKMTPNLTWSQAINAFGTR